MIKDYLELGQIVGVHGVKGEMRFQPWADSPSFAAAFKTLYLDAKGEKSISVQSRVHGNVLLVKTDTIQTVEEASAMRNRILYIKRSDASLPEGTWFVQELTGCHVFDADDGREYGVLSEVSETGANDVWHICDAAGREYLIPAIPPVVIETDVANDRILIRPLKGIFDDAD